MMESTVLFDIGRILPKVAPDLRKRINVKGTTMHTTGPWHLNGSAIEVYGKNNHKVASVATQSWAGNLAEPEVYANAHLIAAAPDLLAALDNLVGHGSQHEETCDSAEHDDESACIYCEARAAIAKATQG